jgi:hypothetical protein
VPRENDCENANTYAHGGVDTFAKEKVFELVLINLAKREMFFGVLRTLGWLLEWNTALIHCELDQVL